MSKLIRSDMIMQFLQTIDIEAKLPENVSVMNPYRDNPEILKVCSDFYQKYYHDRLSRKLILGINPGRLGAGATGLPFTDTIRLQEVCGITYSGNKSYEPSSSFVYDVIDAYGGVEPFYKIYYINSICPLGFTTTNERGKEVNYNYYDRLDLQEAVLGDITANIYMQAEICGDTSVVFCLGTGKNYQFLSNWNKQYGLFGKVIPLEHPRFVMQYKTKTKDEYIKKYIDKLTKIY